ncbi:MAG TPA: phosphotransferase family protein [Stellaceae bacterium]|nr:phosphotransferase family protein [Stellaceae bacterium]
MALTEEGMFAALGKFMTQATGARRAVVRDWSRLGGGAVQECWWFDLEIFGGPREGFPQLVLRADAPTALIASRSRAEEFALQRAAFRAGVRVAEPLYCCEDSDVIGRAFFVMRWVPGAADGALLVNSKEWEERRPALVADLARQLARIHAIPVGSDLSFLGAALADPAAARIARYRDWLDRFDDPHPVAELALRWLDRERPPPEAAVLGHGDFRTGNFLARASRVAAILDWEFADWGDPHEDIGWFCSKSWRFGRYDREAGGLGARETFYRAYEAEGGRTIDPRRVHYWEVAASLRWLLLALQQRDRFLKGGERSLDLALTGRRPAECEFEILRLIDAHTRTGA